MKNTILGIEELKILHIPCNRQKRGCLKRI